MKNGHILPGRERRVEKSFWKSDWIKQSWIGIHFCIDYKAEMEINLKK